MSRRQRRPRGASLAVADGAERSSATIATNKGVPLAWRVTVPLALFSLLIGAILGALTLGRFPISLQDIGTLALGWLGVGPGRAGVPESAWRVVELVRVPRMLIAGFVGVGLALSGAALQGVFRNPLVDPHVIGVSSGAALGGVLAILFGFGAAVLWSMAFGFGVLALMFVVLLSRQAGRSSILMLVLAGVVVSALFAALVSLATYFVSTLRGRGCFVICRSRWRPAERWRCSAPMDAARPHC